MGVDLGALGVGDARPFLTTPTAIALPSVKAIAAGGLSSGFQAHDGSLFVCGANSLGQLGLGNILDVYVPTALHLPAS